METHVVTGAYGYSGKYIAARLLAQGPVEEWTEESLGLYQPAESLTRCPIAYAD